MRSEEIQVGNIVRLHFYTGKRFCRVVQIYSPNSAAGIQANGEWCLFYSYEAQPLREEEKIEVIRILLLGGFQ